MAARVRPTTSHCFTGPPGCANHGELELPMPSLLQDEAFSRPPTGFPSSIQGPTVWSGEDGLFKVQTLELDPTCVTEVEQALKHFLSLELDGSDVNRENFPLPILGFRLRECAINIHRGSGVCIVRGLTSEKYSAEENTIIFLGISSHIGDQRGVQSSKGAMLTHVYESTSWTVPREKRHGIHTNNSLPFHTDMGCEILAIQIRNCAAHGGGTYVASAAAVYNAMMETGSWAVHTLAKHNWPIRVSSRRGALPFVLAPLVAFQSGNLVVSADPSRIGPHPAVADYHIPDLLPAQKLALAYLQQTATAQQIRLPTRRGDMLFINNWGVLHARDSYQDRSMATRHLVRLWLRDSELGWDIPEPMKAPWESSFGFKARKLVNRQYPVAPMPEYMEPKFTNGSAAFVADSDGDE
ncbi:Clavaminate synthase-like protein [Xylaria venustula]|nr:Clavaminate synthase-like protein [Xylaria venustula]